MGGGGAEVLLCFSIPFLLKHETPSEGERIFRHPRWFRFDCYDVTGCRQDNARCEIIQTERLSLLKHGQVFQPNHSDVDFKSDSGD